ncbi:hypothetical protein A9K55_006372 [Cordyceps militaris]|uniref:Uncharacterized protein n=1 Tax=Cordyceps militaris TaxID=73501 RepID=A0A2H4SA93_CORMI|nr:hypothetical protein A9K55_006372 [Cordyceps militaris]
MCLAWTRPSAVSCDDPMNLTQASHQNFDPLGVDWLRGDLGVISALDESCRNNVVMRAKWRSTLVDTDVVGVGFNHVRLPHTCRIGSFPYSLFLKKSWCGCFFYGPGKARFGFSRKAAPDAVPNIG